ncbi:hypothetical protein LCGC14_0781890 [marine sediment metagenome]|uniref:Uncharacterized protein n=1 Tax=marine sediment metagenome TaxID=412755 RepID=A0A0F9QF50_9ZZZZ
MKFTEYLTHLRKWWTLYIIIWIVIIFGSQIYAFARYGNQSTNNTYSATGVYQAEEPEIAAEWSYLAGLHEDASSRIPVTGGRFFEITMKGENKATLVAAIGDVLAASRNGQENVIETRKPKPELVATPRSQMGWIGISLALAFVGLTIIHGVPMVSKFAADGR